MPDLNDDEAKSQLIHLLKEQKGILMVGAGSSKIVGFPLWPELINELNKLIPSIQNTNNLDLIDYADLIKSELIKEGRVDVYYKQLDNIFSPKKPNNHDNVHCKLVKLGFSGIITTNYDRVLETAIQKSFNIDHCESIDLCEDRTYRIFDFLRFLSSNTAHCFVLHLHGIYDKPKKLILNKTDYLKAYGKKDKSIILDTLHRKVIWALLAMHSLVFVGFSMTDPFFLSMLEIVQKDFALDDDPVHFAIMGYEFDLSMRIVIYSCFILKNKNYYMIYYKFN